MRIKQIKLHGFKSFGDLTKINFDDNLIGIVGPNGSGKSNIIDAVKWVFGEQKSKNLRTTSSTDVIFVGSATKKGMNFAEVTIVYDNSDFYLNLEYPEVEITRRLYKNGDNEYLINGSKCRLKDINNLALDKGFGKDSFSIISQGKVEEIIMAKPDKRRHIVEEVAGILKYKNQKDIATKKINRIDENIGKIEFIISELEKKLEPLKRASQKAEKYKILQTDLKEKEISLFVNEIMTVSEKLEDLKISVIDFQKQSNESNSSLDIKENELQIIEMEITKLQNRELTINNEIAQVTNKIMEINNKITLIQERSSMFSQNGDSKERIDFLNDKIATITTSLNTSNGKINILQPQINDYSQRINKILVELRAQKELYFNNKSELENLEEEDSKVTYPYAVKQVLNRNFNGVIGPVDKLFTIKSGYETAIDVAIGNRRNEIVTVDDKVAMQCVNYLKDNKLGRATFSPLNKIKGRYTNDRDLKEVQNNDLFLGFATDFINFDHKYENVFGGLLGYTIICRNTKDAYAGLKLLNGNYQLITLEGDVVSNNGKLTGGFVKKVNKHQVQGKISKLKEAIADFNAYNQEANLKLENLSTSKNELELEYKVLEDFVEKNEFEKSTYQKELEQLVDNSDNNFDEFNKEIESLTQSKNKLIINKEEVSLEVKALIERKEELSLEITKARAVEKEALTKVNDIKIQIVELENKINVNLDNLREKYSLSYEAAKEFANLNINLSEIKPQITSLKNKIRDLGFINLEAIEQYEKENERFVYYTEQKVDLDNSKNKVLTIINKLDTFVEEQFKDAYEKLNEEFKTVFASLFNGGTAELVLTQPDNLLETGVEIIARPPGKKSQIIGLLSGGEKALTAIALLFAILKIRTIPYAILDEVEAALDEVNVSRYATYLKVFSQRTQFIIITHRQGTMEKVDRLYGVTMPQKGISSVFDVDLKEMED